MAVKPKPKAHKFILSMESISLDSIRHYFSNPQPEHFHSLCSVLVAIAHAGRQDALTLLFGLAYRNRNDISRMLVLVRAARSLNHPEVVALLASEFLRVPSQPSSRTYLTTILDALEVVRTRESWQALCDLAHDSRVGPRYRDRIRRHLDSVPPPREMVTLD